ncbi:MAG: GGDEF domain-containing response regulator [Deltaproteobacteria bacterium]|nr:GGDEF domain-containing response regulator [Deltaproteobacteria bacterium]
MPNTPVPFAVLIVGGSTVDSPLLESALRQTSQGSIKVRRAADPETASRLQDDRPSDVLLLAWDGASPAAETLARLMPIVRSVPLVVLSATDDRDAALQWIRMGAQDCLAKNRASADGIMQSLCFAVERCRNMVALRSLVLIDELTGLYNRRGVLTAGTQTVQLARRRATGLWVLYADVDGLKAINDRFGHEAGDSALIDAAHALRASFRASDVIGRLGGDEFVVLAIDATPESREILLHRIARNLEMRNADSQAPFALELTVGCARFDPGEAGTDLTELLRRADNALYQERGRSRGRPGVPRPPSRASVDP